MAEKEHAAEDIERVARAICVALGIDPDRIYHGKHFIEAIDKSRASPGPAWRWYIPAASVALEFQKKHRS